ncbi:hypothetical protein MKEN_01041700 [Mycena kentingensis (nom. inval.)]|nr:hypothetical protein MKEN_01041700 [Mycena kentingensis (nom. inval.)]
MVEAEQGKQWCHQTPFLTPSMSVQSRIHAFETGAVLQPRIIPSTPPHLSPSPSPPILGRKTSLIDLKDWVFDEGSPPRTNGFKRHSKKDDEDALIHFSPPKKAPPLPPRKPSLISIKTAASLPIVPTRSPVQPQAKRSDSLTVEHTYPPGGSPTALSPGRHTHGSSISSFHSVSLSDGTPSPSAAVFPQHRTPTESSGSSLPTPTVHTTGSSGSVGSESFEELTASVALASPATADIISHDWERAMATRKGPTPPKLPARPTPPPTIQQPKFSPPPTRRPVPAPPSGDRASIRSFASASSSTSASTSLTSRTSSSTSLPPKPVFQFSSPPSLSPALKPTSLVPPTSLTQRPPPIPPGPRKRYDALFTSLHSANATQSQKTLSPPKRRAAGWRGLSVDLIQDPSGNVIAEDGDVVSGDTLPAGVVRVLWCRSRLPVQILSSIWRDCDPRQTGALDRESFARGMWRIDEELRHAAEVKKPPTRRGSRLARRGGR